MCLHPKYIKCEGINCIRGVKDQGNTVLVEPPQSAPVGDQEDQPGEGSRLQVHQTPGPAPVLLSVWDFHFISQRRNLLSCMHTRVLVLLFSSL